MSWHLLRLSTTLNSEKVGFSLQKLCCGVLTFTGLAIGCQAVAGVALAARGPAVVVALVHAAPVPVGAWVPH